MLTYLDPSAWIQRYLDEPGTDQASAIFDRAASLVCSTLGLLEVRAALTRRLAPQAIHDAHLADRAAVTFQDIDRNILLMAEHLTTAFGLRAEDAIHLATALALSVAEDDVLTMVTADRELAGAARASGFEVLDPTAMAE